jgi:penicillin amidase/acyl-homoserine-lactone acylase
LFNSNNTPFRATACADDGFDPKAYSPTLGIQTNMTNRAWRAFETYGSDSKITDETFRRYKFDLTYSKRSRAFGIIRDLITLDPKGDADLAAAQKVLRQWDRRMDVLITQPILSSDFNGKPAPEALDSLKAAITVLKTNFGRLDPEWGQLNRIRRGSVDIAIDGGADTYRSVWGDLQKDGTLTARAGDTLIMFVTWDKKGRLTSQSVHQFGSATLDAKSAHYADQVPLFVAMRTKPVFFTESQLAGHVRQDYTPADAH